MRIHLTGIGGVGMAGLAFLLKRRGHQVDGCDLKPTPRTKWLESIGIPVAIGHDASHVDGKNLVIVTPAVSKDNPEYLAALKAGACDGSSRSDSAPESSTSSPGPSDSVASRVKSRGEVLAELVSSASDSIAVCGSHGKTTTSTFIAKLLIELGESVDWAIGGETGTFPVAGFHVAERIPQPQLSCDESADSDANQPGMRNPFRSVLVVEADESDGTLALYHAKTLVVTNCEYDHPDHFKSVADYFACYDQARRNAGTVIEGAAGDGSSRSDSAPGKSRCSQGASDSVRELTLGDPNALLAVRVALSRGHSIESIAAVLPRITAELPDRRFQRIDIPLSNSNSSLPLIFTDYGHHPTEIRFSINRARTLLADSRGMLRVLFQPHRYSRTAAFKREFAEALMLADEVVICPIYSAFERPIEGGDSCDLYAAMREVEKSGEGEQRRTKIFLAKSCEDAWEHARNSMKSGDITLIQGAGDIINLVPQIQKDLSSILQSSTTDFPPAPRRRIWIGAGSNTVKTDLNLSVDYVKSDSPAGRIGMELLSPTCSLFPITSSLFPWMAGIPGTLGGWVKMNAGAHGHSISEVIDSVKVDGKWIPASECGFGYRTSNIAGEIQDVKFKPPQLLTPHSSLLTPSEYLAKRRKFPAHTRGSVFKNPEGGFAGQLLEECGCKGLRVGGAYVWGEHANVIVAPPGEATASDFLALAQIMRNRVLLRKGLALSLEVRF